MMSPRNIPPSLCLRHSRLADSELREIQTISEVCLSSSLVRLTLFHTNSNLERLVVGGKFIQLSYARKLFRPLPTASDPLHFGRASGQRSGAAVLDYRLSAADSGETFSL